MLPPPPKQAGYKQGKEGIIIRMIIVTSNVIWYSVNNIEENRCFLEGER